ncbi:MAG TPA: hypothetical protein VF435_10740 [Pyrinomonadaceae bacterium]
MKRITPVMLIVLLLVTYCPQTNAVAQGEGLAGRTITGTVYFMSGRRPGRSLPFTLRINRITTPDEVRQLNAALQAGRQDELLRELSRLDAGRIQIGTSVGLPANAIMVDDQGNGRTKITVLYQRDVRFGELRRGARSTNYPFGYAELYVGRGDNEGMLIPAAHVRLRDGNTWEVEDFGTFPARLMGLRVRGSGPVG